MILELVEIDVKPEATAAFEAAFAQAIELVQRAKGCASAELMRSIEQPNRYRLFVRWNALEDHTEGFRGSPDHQQMRALIGPFTEQFAGTEHHAAVLATAAR